MRPTGLVLAHTDQRLHGGGERVLLHVAERVRAFGQVDLLLMCDADGEGVLSSHHVFAHSAALGYPLVMRPRSAPQVALAWRRHADALRNREAVLSFSWPAAVRCALAATRGDSKLAWLCQETFDAPLRPLRRGALAIVRARGTRIVCPSRSIARQLRVAGYPESLLTTIPNGVDTHRITPVSNAAERDALRARLGLPAHGLVVLCPARIDGNKRQSTLIRAVASARRRGAQVWLVCVGESYAEGDGGRERLERLVSELGVLDAVRFVPHQAELRPWLAASDVVALASLREAASLVLLEGAAMGLPVVASRIESNAELVVEGETGLLFEPEDFERCAEHFVRLANDSALCARLGATARRRCVAEFSRTRWDARWDAFLADWLGREARDTQS